LYQLVISRIQVYTTDIELIKLISFDIFVDIILNYIIMSHKQNSVQFVQVTTEQLGDLIDERLSKKLEALKTDLLAKEANDELLTREQAAKFLDVDVSTLYLWVKKGKITAHGIANRRYFKRSELIESLTPVKHKGYEY
jgi:excisionase family DNA binding protein